MAEHWRNFLNEDNNNTNSGLSYLIFLQKLASADGKFSSLPYGVNHYLLRACDGTSVSIGSKRLFMYAKLGPIVLITSIKPKKIPKIPSTRVKMRGEIPTSQYIDNPEIWEWIFVTRPSAALSRLTFSQTQKQKINDRWNNSSKKMLNSMTYKVGESDFMMDKGYQIIKPD